MVSVRKASAPTYLILCPGHVRLKNRPTWSLLSFRWMSRGHSHRVPLSSLPVHLLPSG